MFQSQTPIPYRSFEETPFTWISTPAQLKELIDKLRKAREIALDLEHHSYRTYSGFVCLMQISTREEDWIVDPFELRDELEDLNEVFTDPSIVKAGLILAPVATRADVCFRSYMALRATSFGSSRISICIL
jgi:exosome complex exonuclease RRP6